MTGCEDNSVDLTILYVSWSVSEFRTTEATHLGLGTSNRKRTKLLPQNAVSTNTKE